MYASVLACVCLSCICSQQSLLHGLVNLVVKSFFFSSRQNFSRNTCASYWEFYPNSFHQPANLSCFTVHQRLVFPVFSYIEISFCRKRILKQLQMRISGVTEHSLLAKAPRDSQYSRQINILDFFLVGLAVEYSSCLISVFLIYTFAVLMHQRFRRPACGLNKWPFQGGTSVVVPNCYLFMQ